MYYLDSLYDSIFWQNKNKRLFKFSGKKKYWKKEKRRVRRTDKDLLYNATRYTS